MSISSPSIYASLQRDAQAADGIRVQIAKEEDVNEGLPPLPCPGSSSPGNCENNPILGSIMMMIMTLRHVFAEDLALSMLCELDSIVVTLGVSDFPVIFQVL